MKMMDTKGPKISIWVLRLTTLCSIASALSFGPTMDNNSQKQQLSRRKVLASIASTSIVLPTAAAATPLEAETVDIAAFNAARASGAASKPKLEIFSPGEKSTGGKAKHTILPKVDPPPYLPIRGGRDGKSTVQIPRVGYSLYKTPPEQVSRCVALALRSGVRHFDVGTLYASNAETAKPLRQYLDNGLVGLKKNYYDGEKEDLLELIDATSKAGEEHAVETFGFQGKSVAPPIDGSAGRRARRDQLFISHKISNDEQSLPDARKGSVRGEHPSAVKRNVKKAIAELGVGYLDMALLHSPLTDKDRRLASYQALLELRDAGFIRSVGVCNYGLGPLKEIQELVGENTDDLPAINQLELSPFNMHSDVVEFCDANGIAVGCSAWSKLSGTDGPAEGWAVLAELAQSKGMTKAQLLVRWSMQRGYVCVPRSASKSKIERVAIAENTYGGVNPMKDDGDNAGRSFVLTEGDMKILDGLDIKYKAGKLGRRDGWADEDVTSADWDPTELV